MNKDDALKIFEMNMQFRGLSPNTIKMYKWRLNQFLDYAGKEDITELAMEDAQQFVIELRKTYAPQSLNQTMSAIRYFYDVVLSTPLSRRQFPNIIYRQHEIYIFSPDQIKSLLDTDNIRLKAFIMLGLDAGFRVSEVANLKVRDIHTKDPSFKYLYIHNSKRGKSRKVPLSDPLHKTLQEYWKVYRPAVDGYLFTNLHQTNHINQNYINKLFKSHLRTFDFYEDKIRFHNLRDTYATLLLRNGCNIFTLKKLLGHSSFSSTARYVRSDTSDLEKAPFVSASLGIK